MQRLNGASPERQHVAHEVTEWPWEGGALHLALDYYLAPDLPDLAFVTSVRALMFRGDEILIMKNRFGEHHIIPGGRLQPGETLMACLERELREETDYSVTSVTYLGYLHYHHLTPKPAGYPYPYPDFLQLLYRCEAGERMNAGMTPDEHEVEFFFTAAAECGHLPISVGQKTLVQVLLHAAE